MEWFFISLLALFFYGVKDFLLKVGVQGKCSEKIIMLSYCVTVCLLATVVFLHHPTAVPYLPEIFLLAFINGILSLSVNVFRYAALRYVPATIAYPLFDMSIAVIIVFSFLFLHERLTGIQYLGVVLIILSTQLISRRVNGEKKKYHHFGLGLFYVFCSLICASITPFLIKQAVELQSNSAFFIALCYAFSSAAVVSFMRQSSEKRHIHKQSHSHSIRWGIIIGIFNFFGFYAFMEALHSGTVSLVSVISNVSVVILVLLSSVLYKEKLTTHRIFGIIMSIFALLLLRG